RRHIAAVGDIPHSDEAQFRIQPRIFRRPGVGTAEFRLARYLRVKIYVKMIGSGQINLAVVNLQLPWLIADSGTLTFDFTYRSHIAVRQTIEKEQFFGIRYHQNVGSVIDPHADSVAQTRLRALDVTCGRDVAVRLHRENCDGAGAETGDQNLAMF